MGNLFGIRRRAPQVTPQDMAVFNLKQQRDKIKIYQKKIQADLDCSKELAISLFQKGLTERALVVMRRKKYMEDIINRTDKQLETLEQLVADIEYTQIETSVVEGLRVGTEALKQLTSLMDIDAIQQMMDDTQEAAEKQKQISDILQRSSERYDDNEFLAELEKYKQVPQVEDMKEPAKVAAEVGSDNVEDKKESPELAETIDEMPSPPSNPIVDVIDDLPSPPTKTIEQESAQDDVEIKKVPLLS